MRSHEASEIPPGLGQSSIILLDDGDWLIGVPLTPWAAIWWGRQTAWCTASDISAFDLYHRQGHLIVFRQAISSPAGCRAWQLHAATGEFRDQHNRRVSWRGFLARHPELAGKMLNAIATGLAAAFAAFHSGPS